jgi:hypothetical protein
MKVEEGIEINPRIVLVPVLTYLNLIGPLKGGSVQLNEILLSIDLR